jgi:hypothetical protein
MANLRSTIDFSLKICASGVPTGNGELAKSQFSCSWPAAKDIIHWPMASLSNQILFDWDTNRIK